MDHLVEAYGLFGYAPCQDGELESGLEKIAIYGDSAGYTHAARQLPDGRWASKLGRLEDIEDESLAEVTGALRNDYGAVVEFLAKQV